MNVREIFEKAVGKLPINKSLDEFTGILMLHVDHGIPREAAAIDEKWARGDEYEAGV